jgi:hypothetical protein
MCVRIVQKPPIQLIDGIPLDRFEPGQIHEVGNHIGSLLLAEGWAVPASVEERTSRPSGVSETNPADAVNPSRSTGKPVHAAAADTEWRRRRGKRRRKR